MPHATQAHQAQRFTGWTSLRWGGQIDKTGWAEKLTRLGILNLDQEMLNFRGGRFSRSRKRGRWSCRSTNVFRGPEAKRVRFCLCAGLAPLLVMRLTVLCASWTPRRDNVLLGREGQAVAMSLDVSIQNLSTSPKDGKSLVVNRQCQNSACIKVQ